MNTIQQDSYSATPVATHAPGRYVNEFPGPRSRALHERRTQEVAHSISSVLPVYIEHAEGSIVTDVDGNRFIDFGAGIGVLNVGNSAPAVVEGIKAAAEAFTHTCFLLAPYEGYVEVCAALNRITPGDHSKKTALFNSGAEAVENAVKFARSATGRPAIVVFDNAFHGRTNLTMAMTSKSDPYKTGFGPFANEVYRVAGSYPFRDGGLDGVTAARRAIGQIERQVGTTNAAAVVIEPIQGEGGFIEPAPGFLSTLAEWCRENEVVFIVDEIQSGFGRSGTLFAIEHEAVVPDMVVTAKGLAGGMPLSAVTGRAELMDAAQIGGVGGTYAGNPLACAAAVATIQTIEIDGLVERSRRLGAVVRNQLEQYKSRYPIIGDVRGRGLMQGIEFVKPGTNEPNPQACAAVAAACHRQGVLVLATGTYSNVIRLLPPLNIPEELLSEGLEVFETVLRTESDK